MRTTFSVIAAIVGTVSATPYPYGYGASYNVPSGSASIKGHSTDVVPSGKPPYIKPSGSVYVPIPSGHSHSLSGSHGPYTKPTGTGYDHSSSSYTVPSGSHGSYTKPSGTGHIHSYTVPSGSHGPYTKPSGTGFHTSSSIHTVHSDTKTPSGTGPKGSSSVPTGTGSKIQSVPASTGSVTKSVPAGTSATEKGQTTPVPHGHTYTITGNVPSTKTVTHYGTTTYVETITTFVPCSTPIATSESSIYYSSYLTVSYSTKTVTSITTDVEVICPATTPSQNQATGGSGHGYVVSEAGSGSKPSTVKIIPTTPTASYAPHTIYNSAPAPTAGTCPAEKTVYSTVVVEITKTLQSPSQPAPTPCPVCETHTFTLPNGSPITTIISPSPAASTQTITHGDSAHSVVPPFSGHNDTVTYPTGTGKHTGYSTTGEMKPSGTWGVDKL